MNKYYCNRGFIFSPDGLFGPLTDRSPGQGPALDPLPGPPPWTKPFRVEPRRVSQLFFGGLLSTLFI